jgi:hypothetical protein
MVVVSAGGAGAPITVVAEATAVCGAVVTTGVATATEVNVGTAATRATETNVAANRTEISMASMTLALLLGFIGPSPPLGRRVQTRAMRGLEFLQGHSRATFPSAKWRDQIGFPIPPLYAVLSPRQRERGEPPVSRFESH